MSYTILVIDDDEPIHFMTKSMLGKEFILKHARDAQEAINILSEGSVNLILSDIHMPGLSGLEFLESVRLDKEKNQIPILIMTNLPTIEKEKKAFDLGAADFIKKERFNNDREAVIDIIRMKLVTDIHVTGLEDDIVKKKDQLVMKLMEKAIKGSFEDTIQVLISELNSIIETDLIGLWVVEGSEPKNVVFSGNELPADSSLDSFDTSQTYQFLKNEGEPFLSNHVFNEEFGSFLDFSKLNGMPAEIGIPLHSVNERTLLMNNMQIPDDAEMFSVLVLKRKVLFSSKEFELVSRLVTQAGSILWRLYKKSNS